MKTKTTQQLRAEDRSVMLMTAMQEMETGRLQAIRYFDTDDKTSRVTEAGGILVHGLAPRQRSLAVAFDTSCTTVLDTFDGAWAVVADYRLHSYHVTSLLIYDIDVVTVVTEEDEALTLEDWYKNTWIPAQVEHDLETGELEL